MPTLQYRDGRTYDFPESWPVIDSELLSRAREMAYLALGLTDGREMGPVLDRLRAYYSATGNYAGALFSTVQPNDPNEIGAADLLAVTTLSIDLTPIHLRRLLQDDDTRTQVHRYLAGIEPNAALTDLQPGRLDAMWDLHLYFKSLLSTEERASSWWVFAAKLCARKRPQLFPVRDSLVCAYLAGGKRGHHRTQPGNFSIDMQIFADLITDPQVRYRLDELDAALVADERSVAHESRLRLLDVALWTQARQKIS